MHGLVALGSSLVRQLLENMSKILRAISFWLPFSENLSSHNSQVLQSLGDL